MATGTASQHTRFLALIILMLAACAHPTSILPPSRDAAPAATAGTGSQIETITLDAANVTGGVSNAWGGHQTRIVHTRDGVYSAYITTTFDPETCEWRLARRKGDGSWPVIATGPCHPEPVNLLASPDGTLHVVTWLKGGLIVHSGCPNGETIVMNASTIAIPEGQWSYGAAGADSSGSLCIVASEGGWDAHGRLLIVHRAPGVAEWTARTVETPFRHCYAYVHPRGDGGLVVSATRDTTWRSLGQEPSPDDKLGYAFNAFAVWHTPDISMQPLAVLCRDEARPAPGYIYPALNPQMDSFVDSAGRLHLLYFKECADTGGLMEYRHRIIGTDGSIVHDGLLPSAAGRFNRFFEDSRGRFWLLSSNGLLFPMTESGTRSGEPVKLDLGTHHAVYSGMSIACLRTGGASPAGMLDIAFPGDTPGSWLYLEARLPPP